ncbi:MAG: hypothetical protein CEN91_40 [Candidatus Berkelbacteria bacterium Licking1014_85]|uniref:Uncharacterized protein n=1 Tax=Candidatus Berkelbacteria bacterium Licking1014_85 TaxID=2017148 RepID=A0A554LMG2_9BACT|nr:MAG: hypothetical protein CEN91_40 [Candidatus Berkelbacteria bacterium Licking1014_85]
MNTQTIRSPKISLTLQEARKLFILSNRLVDLSEEILENQAAYNPEFLKGLKLSIRQAKQGNTTEISSIMDLI